jgi:hypothetical protein
VSRLDETHHDTGSSSGTGCRNTAEASAHDHEIRLIVTERFDLLPLL